MFSYFPNTRQNSLRTWSPFQLEFEDVFGKNEGARFAPEYSIDEDEQHFFVSMDVPGVHKEDIAIELEGNELVIVGERKWHTGERTSKKLTESRRFGKFERRFSVPATTRADSIEAQFDNGVLTVVIAKPEQMKKAKINIGEAKTGGGFFKRILSDKAEDTNLKVTQ